MEAVGGMAQEAVVSLHRSRGPSHPFLPQSTRAAVNVNHSYISQLLSSAVILYQSQSPVRLFLSLIWWSLRVDCNFVVIVCCFFMFHWHSLFSMGDHFKSDCPSSRYSSFKSLICPFLPSIISSINSLVRSSLSSVVKLSTQ